jgi:hypothetical protein
LQAAEFFQEEDPQLGEKLLLRVQAAKPNWPSTMQFANLYSSVLAKTGSQDAFALEIRRKLDESKDSDLLAAIGHNLATGNWGHSPVEIALGKSYLERALWPNVFNFCHL